MSPRPRGRNRRRLVDVTVELVLELGGEPHRTPWAAPPTTTIAATAGASTANGGERHGRRAGDRRGAERFFVRRLLMLGAGPGSRASYLTLPSPKSDSEMTCGAVGGSSWWLLGLCVCRWQLARRRARRPPRPEQLERRKEVAALKPVVLRPAVLQQAMPAPIPREAHCRSTRAPTACTTRRRQTSIVADRAAPAR